MSSRELSRSEHGTGRLVPSATQLLRSDAGQLRLHGRRQGAAAAREPMGQAVEGKGKIIGVRCNRTALRPYEEMARIAKGRTGMSISAALRVAGCVAVVFLTAPAMADENYESWPVLRCLRLSRCIVPWT